MLLYNFKSLYYTDRQGQERPFRQMSAPAAQRYNII